MQCGAGMPAWKGYGMKLLKAIDLVLDNLEKYACALLLAGLTAVTITKIILRIASLPSSWTEELARLMFVWCIYIGTAHAARYGKHLKVDILSTFVKDRGNYVFRLITNVSSILFFVLLSYIMTLVLQFMLVRPQRSAAIGYDMFFAYLSVFVCAVLSCIRYVEDIVRATVEYKEKRQAKEGV